MNALPISHTNPSRQYKHVTFKGTAVIKLLNRTEKWIHETLFMEKEAHFFSWIVYKAQTFSGEESKKRLVLLHQNLILFKNHDLRDFLCTLRLYEVKLTAERNCRYPPIAFANMYEAQDQLEVQFEELHAVFKEFKSDTFDLVEEFLTISIY